MQITLSDYITDKGEGDCNEDLAGTDGLYAWVIDGATDLSDVGFFQGITDARWLVDQVALRFSDVTESLQNLPLPAIFSHLASEIRAELQAVEFPNDRLPPACSFGLMRVAENHEEVELALVGDVYLFSVNTGKMLCNTYFSKREEAGVKQARNDNGSPYAPPLSDRQRIAERRRSYIDGTNGHYVLSNNPEIRSGVQKSSVPARPGDRFLLCTDGFARLVESYHLYDDWPQLAESVMDRGLKSILDELRLHESGTGHSRMNYKSADDVCAVLLTIEE